PREKQIYLLFRGAAVTAAKRKLVFFSETTKPFCSLSMKVRRERRLPGMKGPEKEKFFQFVNL
ncbi:MAG: hypothetical protein IJR34_05095, partial [Bacteroidales bacterium]|nr:hypothetical protein [Bacteroidales bacterium]